MVHGSHCVINCDLGGHVFLERGLPTGVRVPDMVTHVEYVMPGTRRQQRADGKEHQLRYGKVFWMSVPW